MSTTIAAALVAAGLRLVASHEYPDGAPPGFSGGFKEESCTACHFDAELNTPPGRVVIDGVPAAFVAGEKYLLTIRLTRDGIARAGFQLTARFKENGAQAGSLKPGSNESERIKVEKSGAVEYAGHDKAGSTISQAGVAQWSVEWIAPEEGGPVLFHVAANAADGNGSAGGDFIYTTVAESVRRTQGCCAVGWFE